MVWYALITLLSLALVMLAAKYLGVKRQLKSMVKQLRDESPRRRSLSVGLSDNHIESLALSVNLLIEEYSQQILNMEKDNYHLKDSIADISHDIRTPLTSIIGYLQLLGQSGLNHEHQQLLNVAIEKSQYLRSLLSGFHELAALNASEAEEELAKVDLAGVLSEIILDNADGFSQKGITPIFETADIPAFIFGDPGKLRRALQNLVSNCLKYSCGDVVFTINPPQKSDDAGFKESADMAEVVTLTIENPVDSMAEIDTTRLFDRFYKADNSRSVQGSGLGLAITKLLVENMGGEISACVVDSVFTIKIELLAFEVSI